MALVGAEPVQEAAPKVEAGEVPADLAAPPATTEDTIEQHNPAAIAHPDDVAQPPLTPETGVAVTTGAAGLSGGVEQAQTMLTPFADTLKIVQYVLIGLTMLALGMTVWGFIHQRRVKAAVG